MNQSIIGTEVDGYRIQEMLGQGGMGVVYKAEDVALSRTVAIKRINPSLANDDAFLRRFRSEARALARIDSPYIVGVHAMRQTSAGLLIVMEYVDGGTVKDLVLDGPMDWRQAMPVIKQMLKALEHAHGADVVHRDIKPHNIMLSQEGTVKVTDFGLAKVHRGDDQRTVTQGVYGTLNYMSPEQVQGGADLDHRSDLYSLGMTIYEMLAGDLPFEDDASEFAKMRMIVEEDLPRPDQLRPQVPDGISALVMKALAKRPDDRFSSATEMREAFEAFETKHGGGDSRPPRPGASSGAKGSGASAGRRWGWMGAAVAVVLLLSVGGYVLYGQMTGGGDAANDSGNHATRGASIRLSIDTDPIGADVYQNGQLLGVTPLDRAVEGDSITLRVQKSGYVSVDTTVRFGGQERAALALTLDEESAEESGPATASSEPSNEEQEPSSNTSSPPAENASTPDPEPDPPAQGTLSLRATPSGTVYVNGEARGSGGSIRVPAGTHQVRFAHPQYGARDTTLTVRAGATEALTCYFEHPVSVRTDGAWGNVFINGENTQTATGEAPFQLGADTYDVEVRIRRGDYVVSGGVHRWIVGEERFSTPFSGSTRTLTLRPSFAEQQHVIEFHVIDRES